MTRNDTIRSAYRLDWVHTLPQMDWERVLVARSIRSARMHAQQGAPHDWCPSCHAWVKSERGYDYRLYRRCLFCGGQVED